MRPNYLCNLTTLREQEQRSEDYWIQQRRIERTKKINQHRADQDIRRFLQAANADPLMES